MNTGQKDNKIPSFMAPFLWSFDLQKLDLERDKKRIITNSLNYGTKQATDWVFSVFAKEDIEDAIKNPLPGEWNKKSINFWSLILNTPAGNLSREVK